MKKIYSAVILIMAIHGLHAQQNFELKNIRTDLKNNAVGFVINYLSDYNGLDVQKNFNKAFLTVTPQITVNAGTSDAFSQIDLKLSGFYLTGSKILVDGKPTFNTGKTFHVFPVSVGIESNGNFNFLNSLVEIGYAPLYYLPGNKDVPTIFKFTRVGIFIQAGYKSKLDTAKLTQTSGGKIDESDEVLNSMLLRTKATLAIDTKNLFHVNSIGCGIIASVNYWFDFINSKSYYNLKGKFRVYLSTTKYFDLTYEKGSGAPNFNQGDQFGMGLTVAF